MLVTSKKIFEDAIEQHYAIPAPNFFDFSSANTYVRIAEELKRPLILAFAQAHIKFLSLEDAAMIGKYLANKAKIPIVLHLDHGTEENIIKKAIDLGFTSVMIDASEDIFEENIRKTKNIVAYAHSKGAVVEAELGHVGSGQNYENHHLTDSIYTDPQAVQRFVEETSVDSLAVSIGTAHGFYKGEPKLNFDCLKEIREKTTVPLVLHGGSSSGDVNLHRCAVEGIAKINIFTDFVTAAMSAIHREETNDYLEMKNRVEKEMAAILAHYYQVLGGREWRKEIRAPFFCVNPKAYLYGESAVEFALLVDQLAKKYDVDIFFSVQHVDAKRIADITNHLIITVQHMDSLAVGRGMGYILPEALVEAGVQATFINHAEHPVTYKEMRKIVQRGKELGIKTLVCADSLEEGRAAALLEPTIIVCEPSELIGTGKTSDSCYMEQTNQAIKAIAPNVQVLQAAGISTPENVLAALQSGADGTGGTSGIVCAKNPEKILTEMLQVIADYRGGKR